MVRPSSAGEVPAAAPCAAERQADAEEERISAAHYVREMVQSLHGVARHHRFVMLAYLLEMASLEADRIAKEGGDA